MIYMSGSLAGQAQWDPVVKEEGQRNWQRLVQSAKRRGVKADAVPVKGTDGLYIIYMDIKAINMY